MGPSFGIAEVNGTLHDGNYTVAVSNDFGSVTSAATALQVDGTPATTPWLRLGWNDFLPAGHLYDG